MVEKFEVDGPDAEERVQKLRDAFPDVEWEETDWGWLGLLLRDGKKRFTVKFQLNDPMMVNINRSVHYWRPSWTAGEFRQKLIGSLKDTAEKKRAEAAEFETRAQILEET